MSFRRAFLVLLLVAAVLTVPFYYIVYIFSLNQPIQILLVIAAYFVVLGFLIRTLPGLKDSTEFIQNMFPGKQGVGRRREVSEASRNDPHNRENVLNAVQNSWIEGFLHQSIDREIRLQLGIKQDAVPRFDMQRRRLGQADEPIPVEQSITDVYVASGRKLLILGAPGSGKTITLLQLAEKLIAEAREDATKPLPLIFNLSSWGQHQGALADWLVEEMLAQYQIGRDLGRALLEYGQIALLLDALDEVVAEQRDACVTAINTFVAAFGKIDLVVCSRVEDYEKLEARLNLSNAVLIQALSDAQIRGYLNTQPLQHVYAEIKADDKLFELARAPLLLNVIAVAYAEDGAQPEIAVADTEEERIHVIFGRYVARMFSHRPLGDDCDYTQEQAFGWLIHLAIGMQRQGMSEFYIERLQSSWLSTEKAYQLFQKLSVFLIVVVVALIGVLVGSLFAELVGGLISGLFGGIIVVLLYTNDNALSELPERLFWSTPFKKEVWRRIFRGLFVGLFGALVFGLADRVKGLDSRVFVRLYFGILFGLFIGLIDALKLVITPKETSVRNKPNQGIRSATRISTIMMLVSVLGLLAMFGLVNQLFESFFEDSNNAMSISLISLFVYMLFILPGVMFIRFGGGIVIQHYLLRFMIARQGILPYPFPDRRLVTFLDAMSDQLLLRRVGGGWVFIHRYLLEYFASLYEPPGATADRDKNG